MNASGAVSGPTRVSVLTPPAEHSLDDSNVGSLLPEPSTSLPESAIFTQSLEALLVLVQEAESKLVAAKDQKAGADNRERDAQTVELFKKIDEEAKARNSPGFFKAIVRCIKDFAVDLTTDPGRAFSDLGHNIKEMVESPNFWSDLKKGCMTVVKVAAVAAAVAATVVTCGGAGPVLAAVVIALSAASLAQSELHLMEKVGLDPKIAAGIQIGMAVGAAISSFGATSAASTSQLIRAAQSVKQAASLVQGGAAVVGGTAAAVDGGFEKGRLDRTADRKGLENAIAQVEEDIKDLIEQIKAAKESGSSINDAMQSAVASEGQQLNVLTGMRV